MGPWVHNKENKMKKRLLAISLAAGCTALFTACDETTNTDIMNADAAATVDSLPKCDKSYDGMLATIPSKGEIMICTQGEWEKVAKTIGSSTPGSSDGSTAGCTAKTLSDDDGVQIICDGKKVATLKNGSEGEQGETGSAGGTGPNGEPGSKGSNGSNGKDFKLSEGDCSVTYTGYNVVIYDCGTGDTYLENLNGSKAPVKAWNALDLKPSFTNRSGSAIASISTIHFVSGSADPGEGKLERWDEDDAWANPTLLDADELVKNFAVKGKASLTVEKGAKLNTAYPLEPSMGMALEFGSAQNLYSWGGVCLTYKSEKPMELIAIGASKNVARASLGAASKETTVNIAANQFKPDSQDVKLEDLNKSIYGIFVKAVGSLEEGEYENEFAVYELGAYKECSGNTVEDVEAWAKKVAKAAEPLVDDRADKENPTSYKTVTIGKQTWMAENLRLPYAYTSKGGDPMALCPATEEELVANGCFYSWAAAMDSAGTFKKDAETANACGANMTCTAVAPVRGICPDGWHLPSKDEVDTLIKYATFDENYPEIKYFALVAGDANWLGFSATLSGISDLSAASYTGTAAGMWLSTQDDPSDVYSLEFYAPSFYATGNSLYSPETDGLSVRCIQDQAKE